MPGPYVTPVHGDADLPEQVDVVVIGGGIIGTSTTLELAERGLRVALCEKGGIGREQSSRNWGWVRISRRDPREVPLMAEALRLWPELNGRTGRETGFHRAGIIFTCATDRQYAQHEKWNELLAPYQLDSRMVSGKEFRDLLPGSTLDLKGALYTPSDGRAEPQLAAPAIGTPPDLAALTKRALAARQELKLAGLAVERESALRRQAQAGVWTGTEVAVQGGLVSGQPGFSSSLAVPVPIYRQQGEVAEAEANRARAEAEREALAREIALELRVAATDWQVARRQAEAFEQTYLPQAQRLVANAQRRFDAGEGSAAEVLEARRAGLEAAIAHQEALLALRQAQARLERAVGE